MKSEPARRDLENARGHSLSDGKPGAFARGARERSCLTSHLACAVNGVRNARWCRDVDDP